MILKNIHGMILAQQVDWVCAWIAPINGRGFQFRHAQALRHKEPLIRPMGTFSPCPGGRENQYQGKIEMCPNKILIFFP
jgi:hypothetical protein